jgi:hypothetical protein
LLFPIAEMLLLLLLPFPLHSAAVVPPLAAVRVFVMAEWLKPAKAGLLALEMSVVLKTTSLSSLLLPPSSSHPLTEDVNEFSDCEKDGDRVRPLDEVRRRRWLWRPFVEPPFRVPLTVRCPFWFGRPLRWRRR